MRHIFNTLRRRFLATLLLIGVIPFVLTGLVLLYLQNLTLHEQSTRELATLANSIASKLETFVHEMENDARALAALPALVGMNPAEQQAYLHALFQQYNRYAQFGVADPITGQLLVLEPPKKLVSIAHVPSFQAAAQGIQKAIIFPTLSGDQLILHMHTPMWDASNKLVGVFGSPVPLPNLAAILQESCPAGGNAYLLDPTGKIVVQAKEQALPTDLDYAQALGFRAGQLPTIPNAITYRLHNQAHLASYAPVTSFGWMVVVDVPESLVWAPTLRSLSFAGIGLLLSLALSTLAAILLSKSLTDPVRNLAYAAQALEQGDASAALPQHASGSAEIGTLVTAFQNMRQAVTQREESLRQSESRNHALVAAIPDALLRMRRDGTILDLHVPISSSISLLKPALIGNNFQVVIRDWQPRTAIERLGAAFDRTRQTGNGETVEIELPGLSSPLAVEARFSIGAADEILLILRNISVQKQLEAAERKYSSAMEALNDGLATLDADLKFTFVNHAYVTMHGYTRATELLQQSIYQLYRDEEQAKITNVVLPAVRKQGSWRGEADGQCKDGSTLIQELSCIQLETGESVWIVRDITERKRAERALQQAQKMESLGVLAGGVAHDFNNLLSVVMGNAALAQLKMANDSPLRKYVDLISDSAQRAADLTRQLLAYAGKGQFLIETIQLTTLLQENQALLETVMPNRGELVVDLPVGLPVIRADRGQVQQVLMNLVINAAEALGEEGGRVILQAFTQTVSGKEETSRWIGGAPPLPGEYLCLQVEDTGAGIAPANIEKIFDPFVTTKSYGRGLGLSAILGIVQGQKGGIQVESQVGRGSIFRVFFPVTTQTPILVNAAGPLQLPHHAGVALVIDDEENVRQTTGEMLELLGFRVIIAPNGREGIEIFKAQQEVINVILLDMKMPVMDGAETYRQLTAIDGEVPVIFASGYNETETLAQANLTRKRVAYLQKPYLPNVLAAKINEVLPQ